MKIWETFEWPHEWKQQEFVVLHKSGDKKECSNYRTIALISHISKILLYIILKRLKQKLEFEMDTMEKSHSAKLDSLQQCLEFRSFDHFENGKQIGYQQASS